MSWEQFRERVNLFIYDSKDAVIKSFRAANGLITLVMLGLLVCYYGFPLTDEQDRLILRVIQAFFGFYILYYFIKIIYDFEPGKFIRQTKWEAVLTTILAIEGLTFTFSGTMLSAELLSSMKFVEEKSATEILIPVYLTVLLLTELFSGDRKLSPIAKFHPAWIFILTIASLMLIGTVLLLLPEMTANGISLVDALVTSASAVSTTGLATVDPATVFTFKGQFVILALIQIGGLNAVAFGAIFFLMMKMGLAAKHHEIVEDFVSKDSLLSGQGMFRKILVWTVRIELAGIILLYIFLPDTLAFSKPADRLFQSIFHVVSAFNNAGLSILPGGMANPELAHSYIVHFVMIVQVFLGGLGMVYLFDIFEFTRVKERLRYRWKTIEFGTKLTLTFSLALLVLGMATMLIFESGRTLSGKSVSEKIFHSMYYSMTTRNAGYSLYDTATLSLPVLIVFMFLMFVGAGSGSAAGGIRVSTFGVLWASVISTVKGRSQAEIFKRTLDNSLVFKAAAITIFFAIGNFLGIFALSITEAEKLSYGIFSLTDIIFEHISAASTVGLSTGVSAKLSEAGKLVLVVAMFIGRVGTLTVAYLLLSRTTKISYKYPEGHTLLG